MTQDPEPTRQKGKDKVRSAWISFAGRIVAQLVGAIATVSLGVMVLHRYSGPGPQAPLQPVLPSITVVIINPAVSTNPGGAGQPALPAADVVAQQAEMARAIARAVSTALPPAN
jgi:hypothetical protein